MNQAHMMNENIWSCQNALDAIEWVKGTKTGVPADVVTEIFHRKAALVQVGPQSLVKWTAPEGMASGMVSPLQAANILMSGTPWKMFKTEEESIAEDPVGNRLIKKGNSFKIQTWNDRKLSESEEKANLRLVESSDESPQSSEVIDTEEENEAS